MLVLSSIIRVQTTIRQFRLLRCLSDPQEAQLGAKVLSISDMGKEVVWVTGAAGCHAGSVHHRVVVDVFW